MLSGSSRSIKKNLYAGLQGHDHHLGTPLRQDLRGLAIAAPSQGPHPVARPLSSKATSCAKCELDR